jgi:transposase
MESMGRKKSRPRRSFTPEFKAEIVELCQRGDRSVGQVARDFDLTETAVREWVKQAERDAGTRHDGGLTSEERRELGIMVRWSRPGPDLEVPLTIFDHPRMTGACAPPGCSHRTATARSPAFGRSAMMT